MHSEGRESSIMKVRRILILTLALALVGSSFVYADTITDKLKVVFNKRTADGNGIIVGNKAYISADVVSEQLQGLLIWDEGDSSIRLFRPNVHMFTMSGTTVFGDIKKGTREKFNVHTQVDSLKVDLKEFKWTISDPYRKETTIEVRKSGDDEFPTKGKDSFWLNSKDIVYTFESAGSYTIRFWVKAEGEKNFQIISEKIINTK